MSLILAVEPDRRRAAQLASMARNHLDAEFVLAHSVAQGFQALGERVPDLLLTAPLLPPAEEVALDDYLRLIGPAAAHVQSLTIPLLASPSSNGERGMLSPFRRDKQNLADTGGCEPAVFAEQIATYLRETRKPAATVVPTREAAVDDPDDGTAVDLSALLDDQAAPDDALSISTILPEVEPTAVYKPEPIHEPIALTSDHSLAEFSEPVPHGEPEKSPEFPGELFVKHPSDLIAPPIDAGAAGPALIAEQPSEPVAYVAPEPEFEQFIEPVACAAPEPVLERFIEPSAATAPELDADDGWGSFEPAVLNETPVDEPIILADFVSDDAPVAIAAEPEVFLADPIAIDPAPVAAAVAIPQEAPTPAAPLVSVPTTPAILEPVAPVAIPEVLPAVAMMPGTQMVRSPQPQPRPATRPVVEPPSDPQPRELVPYAGAAQVPAPAAPNTVQQIIQVPTGNGTQVGASVSVAVAVSVQVAAAVNVTSAPPKRQKPRPVQDEWGFFDPGQCGFQALVARLDAIAAEEDKDDR